MSERRRYATREELLELLVGRVPEVDWPVALAALAAVGVEVNALVKVTVAEEV